MPKVNLAVIFGGKSVEHEVSVITGLQVVENADKERYNIIPLYIDKNGKWYTGKALLNINNYKNTSDLLTKLSEGHICAERKFKIFAPPFLPLGDTQTRIDVAFPAIHGTNGEDGTLQGLLEMLDIPYVGSGVTGSAVGMDKVLQKDILSKNGISVPDYLCFLREDWRDDSQKTISKIEKALKYPVVVKPANLGSSIGVTVANNRDQLVEACDLATILDRRIIVEKLMTKVIEVNCSVLGYKKLEASVCEQPIKSADFLTYEDKYTGDSKTKGMASLSRIIPAPIGERLTKKIQETAKVVFRLLDASGVARIDFFVDQKTEKVWVCEINTMPGSLAFYLWEKGEYSFPKLIDRLVDLGRERYLDRKETRYSFNSNLLQNFGGGNKGGAKINL